MPLKTGKQYTQDITKKIAIAMICGVSLCQSVLFMLILLTEGQNNAIFIAKGQ
jgi:hypothetical protein